MKLLKKYFITLIFLVTIIGFFSLGRTQGRIQSNAEYSMLLCNDTIYPYGCLIDKNATHCIIFDCHKIGMSQNTAFCFYFTKNSSMLDKTYASIWGTVMYGCPAYLTDIGINPMTKNKNWRIKG